MSDVIISKISKKGEEMSDEDKRDIKDGNEKLINMVEQAIEKGGIIAVVDKLPNGKLASAVMLSQMGTIESVGVIGMLSEKLKEMTHVIFKETERKFIEDSNDDKTSYIG